MRPKLPYLLGLLPLVAAAPAWAAPWHRSYKTDAAPEVRVHTNDADVEIVARDSAGVDFEVEGPAMDSGPAPRITEHQEGNRVELEVEVLPERHFFGVGVMSRTKPLRIHVALPRQAELEVRTGDGNVRARGTAARTRLDTGDGDVELEDTSGPVEISTGDGRLRSRRSHGELRARTGDGDVEVDGATGRLNLSTGDGRIDVRNAEGSLEADSSDGSIRVSGKFDALDLRSGDGSIEATALPGSKPARGWKLQSGDGHVDLFLPPELAADVRAHSSDGSVRSELPLSVTGEMDHDEITGKLNGGGPTIDIDTGEGSILLGRSGSAGR